MLTSTSSEAIAAAQRLLLLSPWSSSMMSVKDGPQSLRESGKLLCDLVLISTTNNNNNNNNACGELRSYLRQMHVEVLVHQINSFWWLVWWCAGYLVWCATQESDSAQQQQQQHDEHTSSSSSSSSLYLKAAQSSAEWQSAPLHKDDGSELFAHLPRAHTIWRQPALLASLTTLAELTWHLQELHQQHRYDGDQSSSSLCCPLCAAARCGNVLAADALWLLLHLHVLRSKTAKAHWGADANHLAQPCLHNNDDDDDDDDDRSLMQHRMLQHGVLVCYAAVEEGKAEMVGRVVGRWMSRGAGAAHNNNIIMIPPSTSSLLHACVCAWMAHVQEIPPPHTADEHRLRDQRLRRSCAAILRAATIEDRRDEDHSSSCIVLRGVLHAMIHAPIFMGAAHQRASTVMEWLSRQQFVETVRVLAHAADVVWSSPSSSSSLRRTKVQVMPTASASTVVGAAPTSRARISLVANTSATTCAEVVTSAPKIVRRYAQLHHCLTACMQDDHEMMMVCSAKHGAALAQLMLVLGASPWPLNPRNVSIVDGAHPLMVEEVRHLLQLHLKKNPNNDNNNKTHSSPASIMHVGDELHQLREHLSTLACAATAANHLAALAYAKWANKTRSLATPQDRALASAGEVVREWADYAHHHDGVLRAAMAALEYDAHQPLARMMMIHVLARKVAALAHTQSVHINRDDDGVAKKKKTKHVDDDGMTRHTSCWLARYHAAVLRMYEQLTNTDALNLLGHVVQQHLHNNNNNNKDDDDDEMRQRLRREYEHVVEEVQTIDALLHATLRTVESQAAQRTNKHDDDDDDDDDGPRSSSSSPIMLMDEADPDRATYIRVAIPPLHTLPPVEGRSGKHHRDHRRWYTTMSTSHDDGMDVYVRVPDEMDVAATIAAHGGAWGIVDRPMPLFAPVQDGDVVVFVQQHRTNNNNDDDDDDDETRFVAVEVLMPASGLHRRRADHRGDDVRAWMRGGRVELPCCLRQKRAATQPTTAEEIMWRPLTHTDDDDDEHLSRSYTSIMAISSSLPMLDAAVDLDLHTCAPMQWMEMEVAPHMLMRDIISHMCASPSLCGRWRNIITGGTSWQWMYEAQAEVVVKQSTSSTCSAVAWGSMRTIPIPNNNNNKDKNDDDDDDDDVVCALPVVAVEERLRGEVDDPLAGCSTEVLCVLQPTRSSPGINADDRDEMHLVGVLPRWGWRLMDGTNLHS